MKTKTDTSQHAQNILDIVNDAESEQFALIEITNYLLDYQQEIANVLIKKLQNDQK